MMSASASATGADHDPQPASVKVWDPFVRFFHWSLVATFLIAWVSAEEWDQVHVYAGYAVAGLVILRVLWGLVGSSHARFSDFVYRPTVVAAYIIDSVKRQARRYIGHNPAGGAMVVALLLCLTAISVTGIMMTTEAFWTAKWLEELHETAVNLTVVLVFIHLGGVILASIEHDENLIKAMVTGRKRSRD